MAAEHDDMSDELSAMSLHDDEISTDDVLTLDDRVRVRLTEIEKSYESIFSWRIRELAGEPQNLMEKLVDIIRSKCDFEMPEEDTFNFHKFHLKLILSFELYIDKKFEEAMVEIKYVVNHMLTLCTTDLTYKQYSNAFSHIALSTYAYIALSMNLDYEKMIENIKPMNEFNNGEKSAICAVKADVFLHYSPVGNDIALNLATQARTLNPTEPEWIVIWLKAKAVVRRYYNVLVLPDNSEMSAAEMLMSEKNKKSEFYLHASRIYAETARVYKKQSRHKYQSEKYYKQASNLLEKAMLLEKYNMKQLGHIFKEYIYLPEQYCSSSLVDEVVQKLQNISYYHVNFTLGKYYLRWKKDYLNAQIYFSRAMTAGTFQCAMDLFSVECLLHPREQFQFVDRLNKIYDCFLNPRRRCIVLAQILIFYCHENDPKEAMHYLKLFIDQDTDESWKKEYLKWAYPFQRHGVPIPTFSQKRLITYITDITNNYGWSLEEKTIVIETYNRFNKMVGDNDDIVRSNYTNKTNENEKTFTGQLQDGQVGMQLNRCEKQDAYQNHYNRPGNQTRRPFQCSSRVYNNAQNDGKSGEFSWRNQKGRVVFKDKPK